MNGETKAKAFKALADPTRLRIVQFLSSCCCKRASVNDDGSVDGPTAGEVCCHITGVDKINSTISHHLHELEDAGLISLEKKGKATLCTLRVDSLLGLASDLNRIAAGTEECQCCSAGCGC